MAVRTVTLVNALAGCSSPPAGAFFSEQSQAIQGGYPAAQDTFVVAVRGRFGTCSATLLAPRLALTARHCVASLIDAEGNGTSTMTCGASRFAPAEAPERLAVATTASLGDPGAAWRPVSRVFVGPSVEGCGNDVALVAFDADPGTDPAPAIPSFADIRSSPATFSAIGYGLTRPYAQESLTRHRRDNMQIACIGQACATLTGAGTNTASEFVAREGACLGDSGSGAFLMTNASPPRVFGVLSRSEVDAAGTTCIRDVFGALGEHRGWMTAAAIDEATRLDEVPPAWANPAFDSVNLAAGCALRSGRVSQSGQAWAALVIAIGLFARRMAQRRA